MNADDIIRKLRMQPHPKEKGYFVETHRSSEKIGWEGLPSRYNGGRHHSTAIYFLLKKGGFSEMHRLQSDEVFHFYLGSPAEMLLLFESGDGKVLRFGNNLELDEAPQIVVPRNTWQGMKTLGEFTLFGCTVSPGFDYADYQSGNRQTLIREYPAFADRIRELT
jgi:uncharacterized protein